MLAARRFEPPSVRAMRAFGRDSAKYRGVSKSGLASAAARRAAAPKERDGQPRPLLVDQGGRRPMRRQSAGFGRTHQSRAAIQDCRFDLGVPETGFAGRLGLPPEQAHRRVDAGRCFARRSDAVAQRPVASGCSCSMASTSGTPGGCSGLTLAMRTVVLARSSRLAEGAHGRSFCSKPSAA